jgi:hypothetical protein
MELFMSDTASDMTYLFSLVQLLFYGKPIFTFKTDGHKIHISAKSNSAKNWGVLFPSPANHILSTGCSSLPQLITYYLLSIDGGRCEHAIS